MNCSFMLRERAAANKPIRIGQIGAGKFGTMPISLSVRLTTGMHLVGLADLMPEFAPASVSSAYNGQRSKSKRVHSIRDALKTGKNPRHRQCHGH